MNDCAVFARSIVELCSKFKTGGMTYGRKQKS